MEVLIVKHSSGGGGPSVSGAQAVVMEDTL